MINDLLQRLRLAKTDEERSWIATESLLESLPEDVKNALWAVAIPHWFDAEILAALCPEFADRAEEIYQELQKLSCVEVFPDRGHNVHELTRNQLLDRLWQDNPERFRELSDRAAAYFAQINRPESQIEWIYQLAVANPDRCINKLSDLANGWQNAFRRAELDSLIAFLQMQIRANRTTIAVKAETTYWDGKIKFRFYQAKEALERYEAALTFYREIGDPWGEANTLQAIGDVLQFLKRSTEELERYRHKAKLSLDKVRNRLRWLAAIITKSTARAYPHLLNRNQLINTRSRLLNVYKQNYPKNQDGITSLFLGITPLILFVSILCLLISPTSRFVSVTLIVSSIIHALVICSSVLVLATIINQNKSENINDLEPYPQKRIPNKSSILVKLIVFIKNLPIWNVIAVVFSVLITILCVISSVEKFSISLLIGSLVLLSSLSICFGGKGGLSGIRYLHFLIQDVWMSLRIASENLQLWLPSRLSRVETNFQEYINLANEYSKEDQVKLPIGPFSKATRAVLTEWYGYNPFPSFPPEPPTPLTHQLDSASRNPNNYSSEMQLDAVEPMTSTPQSLQEALEKYEAALSLYREIGDRLGEANTLKAIGDVLQFLSVARKP
jgi:tetratricopeptide (TPR) repeat protein